MCVRGLLLCRRVSPCLRPSLKDVRNYDTPIREQQAAVTVRYTRADQQAAVEVEPLRLTCASSGADSATAAAAAAAAAVSSASFVASTSLSDARAAHPPVSWPHPLLPAAPSDDRASAPAVPPSSRAVPGPSLHLPESLYGPSR